MEKIGSNVTRVQRGHRVVPYMIPYAQKGQGTWQEYLVVDEADLLVIPDSVSDESASQLFVNPCTVLGILETLQVPQVLHWNFFL